MAVPGFGQCCTIIPKRLADWLDRWDSQTVNLKCDNEPAILAFAQEIWRLRTKQHHHLRASEEGEKQSDFLVEGGVNILTNPEKQHGVEFENRDWPRFIR